jgi:AraC-like DNA-binding protein
MSIQHLVSRVRRLSSQQLDENAPQLPGLHVYRSDEPTKIEAMIYKPIVCLIVQGEKEITIGEETVLLKEGKCVVVGHDLPVLAKITKASTHKPYLSLIIQLDLDLLRTLDGVLDEFELDTEAPRSLEVATASDATVEVLNRYLALAEDPLEAQVLLPLVKKELHFRLLRSESGAMLRALCRRESHASNIGRAIVQLQKSFHKPLDVTELARSVGMSPSSFHKHFKSMTRTTPLQYQKDLRLTEARRLLLAGVGSVSSAAFDVGYESPSQFSREYSRKFGVSPRENLRVA